MAGPRSSSRPPALRGGAAQVPAIHVGMRVTNVAAVGPTWMPATSAGMTKMVCGYACNSFAGVRLRPQQPRRLKLLMLGLGRVLFHQLVEIRVRLVQQRQPVLVELVEPLVPGDL